MICRKSTVHLGFPFEASVESPERHKNADDDAKDDDDDEEEEEKELS